MGKSSIPKLQALGLRDARTLSIEPKRESVPCIQRTQEGTLTLYFCLVSSMSPFRGTKLIRISIPLKTRALGEDLS